MELAVHPNPLSLRKNRLVCSINTKSKSLSYGNLKLQSYKRKLYFPSFWNLPILAQNVKCQSSNSSSLDGVLHPDQNKVKEGQNVFKPENPPPLFFAFIGGLVCIWGFIFARSMSWGPCILPNLPFTQQTVSQTHALKHEAQRKAVHVKVSQVAGKAGKANPATAQINRERGVLTRFIGAIWRFCWTVLKFPATVVDWSLRDSNITPGYLNVRSQDLPPAPVLVTNRKAAQPGPNLKTRELQSTRNAQKSQSSRNVVQEPSVDVFKILVNTLSLLPKLVADTYLAMPEPIRQYLNLFGTMLGLSLQACIAAGFCLLLIMIPIAKVLSHLTSSTDDSNGQMHAQRGTIIVCQTVAAEPSPIQQTEGAAPQSDVHSPAPEKPPHVQTHMPKKTNSLAHETGERSSQTAEPPLIHSRDPQKMSGPVSGADEQPLRDMKGQSCGASGIPGLATSEAWKFYGSLINGMPASNLSGPSPFISYPSFLYPQESTSPNAYSSSASDALDSSSAVESKSRDGTAGFLLQTSSLPAQGGTVGGGVSIGLPPPLETEVTSILSSSVAPCPAVRKVGCFPVEVSDSDEVFLDDMLSSLEDMLTAVAQPEGHKHSTPSKKLTGTGAQSSAADLISAYQCPPDPSKATLPASQVSIGYPSCRIDLHSQVTTIVDPDLEFGVQITPTGAVSDQVTLSIKITQQGPIETLMPKVVSNMSAPSPPTQMAPGPRAADQATSDLPPKTAAQTPSDPALHVADKALSDPASGALQMAEDAERQQKPGCTETDHEPASGQPGHENVWVSLEDYEAVLWEYPCSTRPGLYKRLYCSKEDDQVPSGFNLKRQLLLASGYDKLECAEEKQKWISASLFKVTNMAAEIGVELGVRLSSLFDDFPFQDLDSIHNFPEIARALYTHPDHYWACNYWSIWGFGESKCWLRNREQRQEVYELRQALKHRSDHRGTGSSATAVEVEGTRVALVEGEEIQTSFEGTNAQIGVQEAADIGRPFAVPLRDYEAILLDFPVPHQAVVEHLMGSDEATLRCFSTPNLRRQLLLAMRYDELEDGEVKRMWISASLFKLATIAANKGIDYGTFILEMAGRLYDVPILLPLFPEIEQATLAQDYWSMMFYAGKIYDLESSCSWVQEEFEYIFSSDQRKSDHKSWLAAGEEAALKIRKKPELSFQDEHTQELLKLLKYELLVQKVVLEGSDKAEEWEAELGNVKAILDSLGLNEAEESERAKVNAMLDSYGLSMPLQPTNNVSDPCLDDAKTSVGSVTEHSATPKNMLQSKNKTLGPEKSLEEGSKVAIVQGLDKDSRGGDKGTGLSGPEEALEGAKGALAQGFEKTEEAEEKMDGIYGPEKPPEGGKGIVAQDPAEALEAVFLGIWGLSLLVMKVSEAMSPDSDLAARVSGKSQQSNDNQDDLNLQSGPTVPEGGKNLQVIVPDVDNEAESVSGQDLRAIEQGLACELHPAVSGPGQDLRSVEPHNDPPLKVVEPAPMQLDEQQSSQSGKLSKVVASQFSEWARTSKTQLRNADRPKRALGMGSCAETTSSEDLTVHLTPDTKPPRWLQKLSKQHVEKTTPTGMSFRTGKDDHSSEDADMYVSPQGSPPAAAQASRMPVVAHNQAARVAPMPADAGSEAARAPFVPLNVDSRAAQVPFSSPGNAGRVEAGKWIVVGDLNSPSGQMELKQAILANLASQGVNLDAAGIDSVVANIAIWHAQACSLANSAPTLAMEIYSQAAQASILAVEAGTEAARAPIPVVEAGTEASQAPILAAEGGTVVAQAPISAAEVGTGAARASTSTTEAGIQGALAQTLPVAAGFDDVTPQKTEPSLVNESHLESLHFDATKPAQKRVMDPSSHEFLLCARMLLEAGGDDVQLEKLARILLGFQPPDDEASRKAVASLAALVDARRGYCDVPKVAEVAAEHVSENGTDQGLSGMQGDEGRGTYGGSLDAFRITKGAKVHVIEEGKDQGLLGARLKESGIDVKEIKSHPLAAIDDSNDDSDAEDHAIGLGAVHSHAKTADSATVNSLTGSAGAQSKPSIVTPGVADTSFQSHSNSSSSSMLIASVPGETLVSSDTTTAPKMVEKLSSQRSRPPMSAEPITTEDHQGVAVRSGVPDIASDLLWSLSNNLVPLGVELGPTIVGGLGGMTQNANGSEVNSAESQDRKDRSRAKWGSKIGAGISGLLLGFGARTVVYGRRNEGLGASQGQGTGSEEGGLRPSGAEDIIGGGVEGRVGNGNNSLETRDLANDAYWEAAKRGAEGGEASVDVARELLEEAKEVRQESEGGDVGFKTVRENGGQNQQGEYVEYGDGEMDNESDEKEVGDYDVEEEDLSYENEQDEEVAEDEENVYDEEDDEFLAFIRDSDDEDDNLNGHSYEEDDDEGVEEEDDLQYGDSYEEDDDGEMEEEEDTYPYENSYEEDDDEEAEEEEDDYLRGNSDGEDDDEGEEYEDGEDAFGDGGSYDEDEEEEEEDLTGYDFYDSDDEEEEGEADSDDYGHDSYDDEEDEGEEEEEGYDEEEDEEEEGEEDYDYNMTYDDDYEDDEEEGEEGHDSDDDVDDD